MKDITGTHIANAVRADEKKRRQGLIDALHKILVTAHNIKQGSILYSITDIEWIAKVAIRDAETCATRESQDSK
jgi:hypothetical protein